MIEVDQLDLLRPVVQVISACVANNETAAEELPELIRSVHAAFSASREDLELAPAASRKPAVLPHGPHLCEVHICGRQDGKKPQLPRKALSDSSDSGPDFDPTSSISANATGIRRASTEPGGSSFPDVQGIPEDVSGLRRGRSSAFGG